ncbi:MAG: hypothetical protein PHD02_04735 [Bacilli bacterium]|nr:hypothetical protein [Bacilli bacterium]
MEDNGILLETLIGIFTIEHSKIKVLLTRRSEEPYKGYWSLLGNDLAFNETLENNVTDVVIEQAGLSNVNVEQCHTFSNLDRGLEDRKIAVTFIGIIDSKTVELKRQQNSYELGWFDIEDIPKTGFDHDYLINYMIDFLKKKLLNIASLKLLFPSDFSLPELQKVYEQILDKNLDRRNFRKKLLSLDLIEETGYFNEGYSGRPAKLYKFKSLSDEGDLF